MGGWDIVGSERMNEWYEVRMKIMGRIRFT